MSRLDKIANGLLQPINPYAKIILGLLTLAWGAWMVNPFWTVFASAPVFSKMSTFAPEWAWGTWAVVCGSLIVLSVYKGYYRWLSRSLGFATWHWMTVGVMMLWGDWQNTGGLTYIFIGLYSLYAHLNIRINYVLYPTDDGF